jgi:hypothetical protein
MKRKVLIKTIFSILLFSILIIGLTGCDIEIIIPEDNASVTIDILGSYYYNIKVDGVTKLSSIDSGIYTITVPTGNNRHFEAIDIRGKSYGYDEKYQNISIGSNTVYLDPVPAVTTGTVYVKIYGPHEYVLEMDDYIYESKVPEGTYSIPDVPTGYHEFKAYDYISPELGSDSVEKYIYTGSNYVYLYPN